MLSKSVTMLKRINEIVNEKSIGMLLAKSNFSITALTGNINGSVKRYKNSSMAFPSARGNRESIARANIQISTNDKIMSITPVNI